MISRVVVLLACSLAYWLIAFMVLLVLAGCDCPSPDNRAACLSAGQTTEVVVIVASVAIYAIGLAKWINNSKRGL